jgi:hypothetical protein
MVLASRRDLLGPGITSTDFLICGGRWLERVSPATSPNQWTMNF